MAENTTQRYLNEEQIALLKRTVNTNIAKAEILLARAEELQKKFVEKQSSIRSLYDGLKQNYPNLNIGIKNRASLGWYQDLKDKIKQLKDKINAAKDNNDYKTVSQIEALNEETEQVIRDILAVCEEIANTPLIKESIANGVE